MVKFLLILEVAFGEDKDDGSHDGYEGYLKRICEMPAIPRVGEYITLGDEGDVEVTGVYHCILTGIVEVRCDVEREITALGTNLADEQSWEYESAFLDDEEEADKVQFRQVVEELRESRAKTKPD